MGARAWDMGAVLNREGMKKYPLILKALCRAGVHRIFCVDVLSPFTMKSGALSAYFIRVSTSFFFKWMFSCKPQMHLKVTHSAK
jgi:hypothetical protein